MTNTNKSSRETNSNLILFSKPGCAPCLSLKKLLSYKNIPYEEKQAFTEDGLVSEEFAPYINAGARTVPVLAKNPDNFSTGSTYESIKFLLN